ncbi:MAG: hypothetical protein ALAOOOJD_00447 [bacterium]|nr:hypothetical protein [bacterium]
MSSLVYSLYSRLRRVEPEKLWTYILTTIVVLIFYAAALQLHFSAPRFDVEKFAEIDFTKFQPPKPVAGGRTERPKTRLENTAVENNTMPANMAPNELPQIDLQTLEALTQVVDPAPQDLALVQRTAALPSAVKISAVQVGTALLPGLDAPIVQSRPGGLAVLGAPSNVFNPKLQAPKDGYGGKLSHEGYSAGRANPITLEPKAGYSTGRVVPIVNDRKAEDTGPQKVVVKGAGETDWKSRDLRKLFHELLEWMRKNPYDFPPALRQYMRFRAGDVTSRVAIATTEAEYELFMLCNESSEDFGLLLVSAGDSAQAICLRDTGFRQQSFYLSKGIAGRNESAAVGSVSMLEARPTFQETSKFYKIFLSWWDKTNAGGVKKS